MFLSGMLLKNFLQKRIHWSQNIGWRQEVIYKISILMRFYTYSNLILIKLFLGSNVFCQIDTTQYHKNQIPQKLEQIVLSSCTHVLFSSVDTNFDAIANNWYSSQTNSMEISILISNVYQYPMSL